MESSTVIKLSRAQAQLWDTLHQLVLVQSQVASIQRYCATATEMTKYLLDKATDWSQHETDDFIQQLQDLRSSGSGALNNTDYFDRESTMRLFFTTFTGQQLRTDLKIAAIDEETHKRRLELQQCPIENWRQQQQMVVGELRSAISLCMSLPPHLHYFFLHLL